MAKRLFEKVSNRELAILIKSELKNIKIISIDFQSRSNNTEYAGVYFSYKSNDIAKPFIEIIDNGVFTFDTANGSLSFEYVGNAQPLAFIIFTAVIIKAQKFTDKFGFDKEFLTYDYMMCKCREMGYLLDKSTFPYYPWEIYNLHGKRVKRYASLAELDKRLELEKINISSY